MRIILSALFLAACTGSAPAPEAKEAPAKAEPAAQEAAEEKADPVDTTFKPISAEGAKVFFVAPTATEVTSPVTFEFGAEGVEVKPAGTLEENTGHHHLIINAEAPAQGEVVPADAQHIHYGKGQTSATLPLDPGEYTITMQLADGMHRSYGPALSTTLKITVVEGEAAE